MSPQLILSTNYHVYDYSLWHHQQADLFYLKVTSKEYVVETHTGLYFGGDSDFASGPLKKTVFPAASIVMSFTSEVIFKTKGSCFFEAHPPNKWKADPHYDMGLKELITNARMHSHALHNLMNGYAYGGMISPEAKTMQLNYADSPYDYDPGFSVLSRKLPGISKRVSHPSHNYDEAACKHRKRTNLWYLVQHLNDHHKMTRDEIADWVETLDIDINFKVKA